MAQPIELVDPVRFWELVQRGDHDACWVWLDKIDRHGYGEYRRQGASWRAHRVAYEFVVGSIPEGLEIDHLCRNRSCVNPAHLEPVTMTENQRRGRGFPHRFPDSRRPKALADACPNGHPYVPGSYTNGRNGRWRSCRICASARRRRWQDKTI